MLRSSSRLAAVAVIAVIAMLLFAALAVAVAWRRRLCAREPALPREPFRDTDEVDSDPPFVLVRVMPEGEVELLLDGLRGPASLPHEVEASLSDLVRWKGLAVVTDSGDALSPQASRSPGIKGGRGRGRMYVGDAAQLAFLADESGSSDAEEGTWLVVAPLPPVDGGGVPGGRPPDDPTLRSLFLLCVRDPAEGPPPSNAIMPDGRR